MAKPTHTRMDRASMTTRISIGSFMAISLWLARMAISFGRRSLVHVVHLSRPAGHWFLVLGKRRHQRLGRQHEGSDRTGILYRSANHFGWVDDPSLYKILELSGLRVVAKVQVGRCADLAKYDRAFFTGVACYLAQRFLHRTFHDVDADLFFSVQSQTGELFTGTQEGHTTAWHDPLFHSRASGMHRVLDASLLFLHLGLSRGSDLDDRDPPQPAWRDAPAVSRDRSHWWSVRWWRVSLSHALESPRACPGPR